MSDKSAIEWTDATWNPVRGCDKVSPGCKHCYAETFAERFRGVPGHPFEQGFDLRLVPTALDLPKRWKQGRLVFVNSMSDLFHEDVPEEYVAKVFDVMRDTPRHQYQVLTKHSERMMTLSKRLRPPPNAWMGVSVENADHTWRIAHLRETRAAIRFLSVEPLLGPIRRLPLKRMDWVIVGGVLAAGRLRGYLPVSLRVRVTIRRAAFCPLFCRGRPGPLYLSRRGLQCP